MTTARRPRGPYRKGLERRAQIMRAALEVFAEHGDRGSSLREIADRVGMSQAGVLHYFGSREELLTAVLAERDTADAAEHASPEISPGEAMARTAEHNTRSPGLVSLFVNLSADATDPEHPAHGFFVERYTRLRETVEDGLRQGQADGSVRTDIPAEQLAQLLISVSDGLQQQWLLDQGIDMVAAIDAFNRLCRPPGA